ncbi:MAG: hypothetical protein ACLRM9_09275 [Collinsella aerofaciens]
MAAVLMSLTARLLVRQSTMAISAASVLIVDRYDLIDVSDAQRLKVTDPRSTVAVRETRKPKFVDAADGSNGSRNARHCLCENEHHAVNGRRDIGVGLFDAAFARTDVTLAKKADTNAVMTHDTVKCSKNDRARWRSSDDTVPP